MPRTNFFQTALDLTNEINDIYAQGHCSVSQRTSKIQILIRDTLIRTVEDDRRFNQPTYPQTECGPR